MISSLNETSIPDFGRARCCSRRPRHCQPRAREEPTAAAQAPSAPPNPDQVVAEVAGKPITLKDVDAKWEEFDAAERARIVQAMYQNRRNMIDAARRRSADRQRREGRRTVGRRVRRAGRRQAPAGRSPRPTSRSSTNRTRIARRAARSISCAARSSRTSRARREQQARAMLVDELKAKSGASVKVMLDPPRYTVPTAADDPVRGNPAGADHHRRVLRLPVPVLRARQSDAREGPRDLRRSRQDRLQGLSRCRTTRRRRRPPKRRAAPASRRSTGRCTTRCSRTSARSKCRRSSRPRAPSASTARRSISAWTPASGRRRSQPAASSASKMGVNSTPTLYVNGRALIGAMPFENFKAIIDEELAKR